MIKSRLRSRYPFERYTRYPFERYERYPFSDIFTYLAENDGTSWMALSIELIETVPPQGGIPDPSAP